MAKYHEAARKAMESRLAQSRRIVNLSALVALVVLIISVLPYWDRAAVLEDIRLEEEQTRILRGHADTVLRSLLVRRMQLTRGESNCENAGETMYKAYEIYTELDQKAKALLMSRQLKLPRQTALELSALITRMVRTLEIPVHSGLDTHLGLFRHAANCEDLILRDMSVLTQVSVVNPDALHAALNRFIETNDANRLFQELSIVDMSISRAQEDLALVDILLEEIASSPVRIAAGTLTPNNATLSALNDHHQRLRTRQENLERIQQGRVPVSLPGIPAETELRYVIFLAPALALLAITIAAIRRREALHLAEAMNDANEKRIARFILDKAIIGLYPDDWTALFIFMVIGVLFWIYGSDMGVLATSLYLLATLFAALAAIFNHIQEKKLAAAL